MTITFGGLKGHTKAGNKNDERHRNLTDPNLKLVAIIYYDMIYWQECQLTKTPAMTRLSNDKCKFLSLQLETV